MKKLDAENTQEDVDIYSYYITISTKKENFVNWFCYLLSILGMNQDTLYKSINVNSHHQSIHRINFKSET